MDLIIQQISEALKISLDKAQELYPIIREQWIWYKALSPIWNITALISMLLGAVILSIIIILVICDMGRIKLSTIKNLLILLCIFIIAYLLVSGFRVVLAPDLMLMMEFLGK